MILTQTRREHRLSAHRNRDILRDKINLRLAVASAWSQPQLSSERPVWSYVTLGLVR